MKVAADRSGWQVRTIIVAEDASGACFTVALAEQPSGEGRHLIIQIPTHEPDDQDARLGMDTYCLMDESGATHYGGIEEVQLSDGALHLVFDEAAAHGLGVGAGGMLLQLNASADEIALLANGLRRALSYGNPARRPRRWEWGT